MPDFALPAVPAKLLPAVLAVSQAEVLLRPYHTSGTQKLADFHLEYLTPAADGLSSRAGQPGAPARLARVQLRSAGLLPARV